MLRIDPNRCMNWTKDRRAVENFWHAVELGRDPGAGTSNATSNTKDAKSRNARQKAEAALSNIVGRDLCTQFYKIEDSDPQPWKSRDILAPILLRGEDLDIRAQLAHWIIHHWGRIGSGENVYAEWLRELGDFSEGRVFGFVQHRRTDRISSWSKLLSFADCRTYPIYDARTAVAVNVAAHNTKCRTYLYMPGTQNTELPPAIKLIHKRTRKKGYWTQSDWSYFAYLYLLRQVVEFGLSPSIIEAETTLFSNAPRLATTWVDRKEKEWAAEGTLPKVDMRLRKDPAKKKQKVS